MESQKFSLASKKQMLNPNPLAHHPPVRREWHRMQGKFQGRLGAKEKIFNISVFPVSLLSHLLWDSQHPHCSEG